MGQFRKKPIVIEAVQVTDAWFDGDHPNPLHPVGIVINPKERYVMINTLEGEMIGDIGDWIITGVQGERYPCKPDIFEATYDLVGSADVALEDPAFRAEVDKAIAEDQAQLAKEMASGEANFVGPSAPCDIAPEGWWCSRKAGHEGPCAAWPDGSGPEDEEQAQYNARVEARHNTVPRWVAMVLYAALDDIDTADDLAKGDDGLYRNLVRRYHQERHKVAQTDGHTVKFHAMGEQPEEVLEFPELWVASPQYVNRLHNLVASMVEHLAGPVLKDPFESAWLSTFDDPDQFPEVTNIVNADKS